MSGEPDVSFSAQAGGLNPPGKSAIFDINYTVCYKYRPL